MQNPIPTSNYSFEDLSTIIDTIKNKYHLTSMEELSGGYTHQIFLGTTKEGSRLVIKIAIKTIQNEVLANKFLSKIGLKPIPKLIEDFEVEGREVVLLEYIEGSRNVFDTVESMPVEFTKDYFHQLGELIAGMHSQREQNFLDVDFQYSIALPESIEFIDEVLKTRAMELIHRLNSTNELLVLCHGDFGPQNSIVAKDTVYLVDFEQVHWGNLYEDLGWFYWITILHYPDKSKELLQSFNKGYLSISSIGLDYEKIKAFAIRKIWSVLPEKVVESVETREAWID